MTQAPTAAEIAKKLTKAQRAVILALGEKPCSLGCSEACAVRMSWSTSRRPALVEVDGAGMAKFVWLNAEGLAVRAILMEQDRG